MLAVSPIASSETPSSVSHCRSVKPESGSGRPDGKAERAHDEQSAIREKRRHRLAMQASKPPGNR